jgi:hypothetical protein
VTWAALLLADPSPRLRTLVLRDLLGRAEDDNELRELSALADTDAIVGELLGLQEDDGSWRSANRQWPQQGGKQRATALALTRLGYLGFDRKHPAVERGTEWLFSLQGNDGAWPLRAETEEGEEHEGCSMIPLQTALPLRALAACGCATDPRAEAAYGWLLAKRLPDGAWPTGIGADVFGRVAGYRRMPHSQWGCRSNTTGALACLSLHPERRHSGEARRALDLLLGRETRERHTLGFEVARTLGAEQARGFITYYARFDVAFVLDLCWRVGATRDDERVSDLVRFVESLQGPYGLWDYSPRPQISRWVTFDLVRSLSRLDQDAEWVSLEPRTPFQTYPRKRRRY